MGPPTWPGFRETHLGDHHEEPVYSGVGSAGESESFDHGYIGNGEASEYMGGIPIRTSRFSMVPGHPQISIMSLSSLMISRF